MGGVAPVEEESAEEEAVQWAKKSVEQIVVDRMGEAQGVCVSMMQLA